MKLILMTLIAVLSVGAFAQELEQAATINPRHVFCEFSLEGHGQLMAVSRQMNNMLTHNRFRIEKFSNMPSLLKVYKMNGIKNLKEVTAEVIESDEGYRMHFYNPDGSEIANMYFSFPPLKAWPLYSAGKRFFDTVYENGDVEFPYTEGQIPGGISFGTILDQSGGDRMYLAVHKVEGEIYLHLGVDIGEDQRLKSGPIPQRLLRTPDGWLRRTHILTLKVDTPELRKNLGVWPN